MESVEDRLDYWGIEGDDPDQLCRRKALLE